jgi:predicted nucleic acid-binding protein
MPKTIISDTSCFIVLNKIGHLDLLQKLYGTIITTSIIASEFGPLPDWVEIKDPQDISKQTLLELQLDKGEASAIALAMETAGCTLILDDYKARKIAESLGLAITGTLGIIVKAKHKGIIESVKPLIAKIKITDFRISDELEMEIVRGAGESI